MSNKKELNEKETNEVSGGVFIDITDPYKDTYTHELDKYETVNYIGKTLYFDKGGKFNYQWVLGTLINSYEKDTACGTERTAIVKVENSRNLMFERFSEIELSLDDWTAHIK